MKNTTFKLAAVAVATASALAGQAYAAGFMLTEQSVAGLGRSYAGIGVDGTDISGVYYNPATMTLHKGTILQAGFIGIGLNLDYAGNDGTTENGREKSQAIPHGYLLHQINDSTWVGLAMTVPFGMGTEFGDDWSQADHGISAQILTFDFNPNVAWKASEKLSFGAGVSVQYASADLTKKTRLRDTATGQALGELLGESSVRSEIDAETRHQLEHGKALTEMLKQPLYQPKTDAEQVVILVLASHGMLDEVPLAEQRARTAAFVRQFHADVSGTMDAITATGKLTPEQTDTILNAWKAYEGGESHGVQ